MTSPTFTTRSTGPSTKTRPKDSLTALFLDTMRNVLSLEHDTNQPLGSAMTDLTPLSLEGISKRRFRRVPTQHGSQLLRGDGKGGMVSEAKDVLMSPAKPFSLNIACNQGSQGFVPDVRCQSLITAPGIDGPVLPILRWTGAADAACFLAPGTARRPPRRSMALRSERNCGW
eukprot:gene28807-biopygen23475